MDRPELIGERIRLLRHYRKLSLKTLAGLAGISVGFLSEVENGKKIIDRRSHLVAVADALRVSVPELIGQPLAPVDEVHSAALATVPAIRAALVTMRTLAGDLMPARTIDELRVETARLTPLRKNCDYVTMGDLLPALLLDLSAAAEGAPKPERQPALRLLVQATYHCTYMLKYLGFADLSMLAADLCHAAARRLGEPLWLGLADFTRLHSLPPDSRNLVRKLAVEAADRLESHAGDPQVQQVYGMLHLSAAMASAIACRPDDVDAHLDEASMVASRTGEGPGFVDMWFGPTNVGFWRVSIAVELGEGGKAPEIAQGLRPELVDSASRQAAYYADLGRGLAQTHRHDVQATRALTHAEQLAPQRIRTSAAVRETVGDMLRRARREAGGLELRNLARRCKVA